MGRQINEKALESGQLRCELFLCHILLVNLGQVMKSVSSIPKLEKCLSGWLLGEQNDVLK